MTEQEEIKLSPENNTKLRKEIIACFNKTEIKFLCDDLGIDYENLSGTTLEDKARELIKHLERRHRIPDLIRICKAKRPKTAWNRFVEEKASGNNPQNQVSHDIEPMGQKQLGNKKMSNSADSKLWKPQVWWVPIIVALIALAGVIIPKVINSAPDNTPTSTPQNSEPFVYPIRVQSIDGIAIPNAKVIIEVVGQAPLDGFTDSDGFLRIFIDGNRVGQPARLIIQATDYEQSTKEIDLQKDILPDVIQLDLQATPTTQLIILTDTPLSLPTTETTPPTAELEETTTPEPTSPTCGTPHPSIAGSEIGVTVRITNPEFTGDCIEVTHKRVILEVGWENVPPGNNLWLLVYSPSAQLYFPHFCVQIQNANGGQNCLAILGKLEPYDIVVVLADTSAQAILSGIADSGSGIKHGDLPAGISEMNNLSLVRTE